MKEQLNSKLLEAVLKFRLDGQPSRKLQSYENPSRVNYVLSALSNPAAFRIHRQIPGLRCGGKCHIVHFVMPLIVLSLYALLKYH